MAESNLPWTKTGDSSDWDMPSRDGVPVCGAAAFYDDTGELVGFAVNVGWNEKDAERRDLIIEAVNSHASQASRIAELEKALRPFARIAEMERQAATGSTVMVNVERCRDALAALSTPVEAQP